MKKKGYRRKTTFEKKNIGFRPSSPGLPGHGSTHRVDRGFAGLLHRPVF